MEKTGQRSLLRLRVALFLATLGLTAIIYAVSRDLREPSYNGQSASKWFAEAHAILKSGALPDALNPIAEAFSKMGADGIKFLLGQLKRKDSQLRQHFIARVCRPPMPLKGVAFLLPLQAPNFWKRDTSVRILSAMGPAAISAVPGLIEACKDENPSISADAAFALSRIASPRVAIPALITCLRARPWRAEAASWLNQLAEDPHNDCSEAIPALRAALAMSTQDDNDWFEVARALSRIEPDQSATVLLPNLSKMLSESPTQDHRLSKRVIQLYTLGIVENLGARAKECLPQVLILTNASDRIVREVAARAAKAISKGDFEDSY